ncbi:hypothetical protein [Dyadobacter diqingensis]|uniref:hypothetical protein n=1 Tax=Dyadobacter diqingensis TaxID=2938121 RepID=UPI0020C192B3|nr:hypothetical protein [Dyadobacter diqingensis]
MQAVRKVAINTGILYGRMLLTMAIALYSTRLVLNALGSIDYGIFNLIAGVIAMLSFLNTAMTASTQRFLSFYQGKNDSIKQKSVFSNSLILHLVIGVVIVLSLEIIGLFLFEGFLNIPENRLGTAKIVYHFMSATVFFTVISVPFTGTLNARENMAVLASVSVIEALSKLSIAILLLFLTKDKLEIFGLLTASVSVLSFILYSSYCLFKYQECSISNLFKTDPILLKELTSFAGWNLFGTLCSLGRTQGLAIMLNIFFGAVVNAAYGIANQVSGQLNFFSYTLLQALNPQIMKSEGANDRQRMLRLSMIASKFGFFSLAIVAIPCMFEMKAILEFWLKEVPDHTLIFCNLILAGTLINQLTIGLQSAIQATGRIKIYQSVVGSIILLNLPIAYILLKLGYPAYMALVSFSLIELIACGFRLYFLNQIAGLSISEYFKSVILREIVPVSSAILACLLVNLYSQFQYRFFLTGITSSTVFILSILLTGLEQNERNMIGSILRRFVKLEFQK